MTKQSEPKALKGRRVLLMTGTARGKERQRMAQGFERHGARVRLFELTKTSATPLLDLEPTDIVVVDTRWMSHAHSDALRAACRRVGAWIYETRGSGSLAHRIVAVLAEQQRAEYDFTGGVRGKYAGKVSAPSDTPK